MEVMSNNNDEERRPMGFKPASEQQLVETKAVPAKDDAVSPIAWIVVIALFVWLLWSASKKTGPKVPEPGGAGFWPSFGLFGQPKSLPTA